ncbi:MAG: fibrobacter succinogenes major paralogous domain-containing protein [Bacteroidales bacterium]|nr:fibrobacter succinogenes major paralogous domain-containing protein [Bacteroidales bacterium]
MTKIYSIVLGLLLSLSAIAQSVNGISYQAVVRDNDGAVISNKNVSVRVSILDGSSTGYSVYSEKFTCTTEPSGLLTFVIGNGSVLSGSFNDIDWDNQSKFIQIETDINGGSNYSLVGVSQLLSVPYALYANKAKEVDNVYNKEEVNNKFDDFDQKLDNYITTDNAIVLISNTVNSNVSNAINTQLADQFSKVYTKAETNNLLNGKLNKGDVYSKTEVDNELLLLAKRDEVYTKAAVDSKVNGLYTKQQVDAKITQLDNTVKQNNYTKTEVDNALKTKANTDYSYSKSEINNKLAAKANSSDIYTKADLMASGKAKVHYSNITNVPANIDIDASDDVKLTGDQVIKGVKRFENKVVLTDGMSCGGGSLSNVAKPIDPKDVATKEYVDNIIIALGDTKKLLDSRLFSLVQLYDGGHSIQQLKNAGVSDLQLVSLRPNDATKLDAFIAELLNAGVSASAINSKGLKIMVGTMVKLGVSNQVLKAADLVGEVTDADNNSYNWVKIGDNKWFSENLKTTKTVQGTAINSANVSAYDNNEANVAKNGRLYNYSVVQADNVCPTGWHIATTDEWSNLTTYVGSNDLGKKIVLNSDNQSGFSAVPSGYYANNKFTRIDVYGYVWIKQSSIMLFNNEASLAKLAEKSIVGDIDPKLSIRCVSK